MRFLAILAAAAVFVPAAAFAQVDKKAAAPSNCADLVKGFGLIETTAESAIEELETGCIVSNVFVGTGSYARYRIGSATLIAPDLFASDGEATLPSEIDLAITGFQLVPDMGSLLNNYIIEVQGEPLDIHVAYRWDKEGQTVELADFSVAAPGYGQFRVAGRLSNITLDPNQFTDVTSFPGAIDALVIEIVNARFFSAMVVPAILGTLPYDADPRPLIDTYKTALTAFIASLPGDNISDDAKSALTTFVTAFPRMVGDYSVNLRADPPLDFSALAVDSPAGIAAILARMQIAADYTPPNQP